MKLQKENLKLWLGLIAFIASLIVGFIALFMPPPGEIHQSVLWFVAQLLVFTATLLGLSMSIDAVHQKVHNRIEKVPE